MENKDALTESKKEGDNLNVRKNLHRDPAFQAFLTDRKYFKIKYNRKK